MKRLNFKNRSLVIKVPALVLSIVMICMVFMTIAIVTVTDKALTKESMYTLEYMAKTDAKASTDAINTLYYETKSLATSLSEYNCIPEGDRGEYVKKLSEKILTVEKKGMGVYMSIEPNTFESNTPNGRSYYSFKQDDKISCEVKDDYDYYSSQSFYKDVKDSNKIIITDPYVYEAAGIKLNLITISAPITDDNGNFIGIITLDVDSSSFLKIDYALNEYDNCYYSLINNNGTYITHTEDIDNKGKETIAGTKYGREFSDIVNDVSKDTTYAVKDDKYIGGKAMRVMVPVRIGDSDDIWVSTLTIDERELKEEVNRILVWLVLIELVIVAILAVVVSFFIRKSLIPVINLQKATAKLSNGVLNLDIESECDDEIGMLAKDFKNTTDVISELITDFSMILKEVSNGNLCVTIDREYDGDFNKLKESLIQILSWLNKTMSDMDILSSQVQSGAEQVALAAQSLSTDAVRQAGATQELLESIEVVNKSIQNTTREAVSVNTELKVVDESVDESIDKMDSMKEAMDDIKARSNEISGIIKTIDSIAFQTNILALNAAVESARAGAAGKGFAVVADEVRNLAIKSAEAAKNTTALLENSITAIERGVVYADATAKSIERVKEGSYKINTIMDDLTKSVEKEAIALGDIANNVREVAVIAESNSATSEESAAASEELSAQAENMTDMLNKIKINR